MGSLDLRVLVVHRLVSSLVSSMFRSPNLWASSMEKKPSDHQLPRLGMVVQSSQVPVDLMS